MQTSNTEEMVTISRAEYERLQQEKARNAKLEAKLAAREQEQAQVITSLTLQNEWLLEQLKLSKKKLFGRSSEQAEQMVMDQLSLTYNELEAYAFGTKAATEKQIAVKAHERKRQSGNVLDVVPEGTPTEVVEHRLPEDERICSVCGSEMVEIGKEVRRSLAPGRKSSAITTAKQTAAAMPPAVAESPPVITPSQPCSATAFFTPLASE